MNLWKKVCFVLFLMDKTSLLYRPILVFIGNEYALTSAIIYCPKYAFFLDGMVFHTMIFFPIEAESINVCVNIR